MTTVAISGGFIILHHGHTRLISDAAEHGNVIVILNSDAWQRRKYGQLVVSYNQRYEVLSAMRDVYSIIEARDDDDTVCETLKHLKPDFFANGGDRTSKNIPELRLCEQIGIKPLFNVGGKKIASSSDILRKAAPSYEW